MLFADDDRHAVVRLNHGSVGNACEDREAVLAVNNLIGLLFRAHDQPDRKQNGEVC